jgi:hypothetical protein
MRRPEARTSWPQGGPHDDPQRTAGQQAQAEHPADLTTRAGRAEILAIARLLVSKPDREVFEATGFAVRLAPIAGGRVPRP